MVNPFFKQRTHCSERKEREREVCVGGGGGGDGAGASSLEFAQIKSNEITEDIRTEESVVFIGLLLVDPRKTGQKAFCGLDSAYKILACRRNI